MTTIPARETSLILDADGWIEGTCAPDRGRTVEVSVVTTPWWGRFSGYRQKGATWAPYAAEVAWIEDGVETVYWQGRLTDLSVAV